MNTAPTDQPAARGDALLAVMAAAVLVGSAAIAGLGVIASWWLLPFAIVTLIALAVGVAYALVHVMDDGDADGARLPHAPESA
jgi:Na+-driven multidrug efflux pump